MEPIKGNQNFYVFQNNIELIKLLTDEQLESLLKNATRISVRLMMEFSVGKLMDVLGYLGIDAKTETKKFGDRRKKSTYIKALIGNLSKFDSDLNKAVDILSYALGVWDNSYLEADEKERLEAERAAYEAEQVQGTIAQADKAILEVNKAIAEVKTEAKKVTKAAKKMMERKILQDEKAWVEWDSDFMGTVHINNAGYREFWVENPYTAPVINLVTSSGMTILSSWDSSKENRFMIEAIKAFHNLIETRKEVTDIESRLLTLATNLTGSKRRAEWYAESPEQLVLMDGVRMKKKSTVKVYSEWGFAPELKPFDFDLLNEGLAYSKCQEMAKKHENEVDYVEGFAMIEGKIINHAWLQDKMDAKAIELVYSNNAIQYYGIPLDVKWVEKSLRNRPNNLPMQPRNTKSIIQGGFLDDYKLLILGFPEEAISL